MLGAVAGPLISAGASLLGGLMGQKKADETQARQEALQREFAQNGIQWKVADAKAAGIHPLYALGASTSSYAPISVGSPLPAAMSNMGQDLSRAFNATRSSSARLEAFSEASQGLQLKNMDLQNQLLASQIAKINQAGSPPAMPGINERFMVEGQPQPSTAVPSGVPGTSLINTKPMERQAASPEAPYQEAGAVSDAGFTRTATGWAPVMSKDAKERLEDDHLGMAWWNVRNRFLPATTFYHNPPPWDPGPGKVWGFNAIKGEYQVMNSWTPFGNSKWVPKFAY